MSRVVLAGLGEWLGMEDGMAWKHGRIGDEMMGCRKGLGWGNLGVEMRWEDSDGRPRRREGGQQQREMEENKSDGLTVM